MVPEKSSVTSAREYPRIPVEHGGIQVNYCKSPVCSNYGIAAGQKAERRPGGTNPYTLDVQRKGVSFCICNDCGDSFPLKSNVGITEEVQRMAAYLLPAAAVFCPNDDCLNHPNQVPVGTVGAYASYRARGWWPPLAWTCRIPFSTALLALALYAPGVAS